MKRLSGIVVCLTVGWLAAAEPDKKAVEEALKKLAGDWECTAAEFREEKAPEVSYKTLTMTIKDATFKVSFEGKVIDEGTVKVDPTKDPKTMSLHSSKTKQPRCYAIYKLDGDKLTICYDARNEPPKEFATKKGTFLELQTYQRKK
jgi:uncharacterized protein (TIGR03067 family)